MNKLSNTIVRFVPRRSVAGAGLRRIADGSDVPGYSRRAS